MNELTKDANQSISRTVTEEDTKSDELEPASTSTSTSTGEVANVSAWATFTGADRKGLQKEPIIFNKGFKTFSESLGIRAKSIFTKRFL